MKNKSPVKIGGRNTNLKMDPSYNGLVTIDTPHERVHDGLSYRVSRIPSAKVNPSAYLNVFLVTSSVEPHFNLAVTSTHLVRLYMREAATASVLGTTLIPVNMNRNSSNSTVARVYTNSTVKTSGTLIDSGYVPAGNARFSTGANTLRPSTEWELKPSTTYLFQIYNALTTSASVGYEMQWYQE